MAPLLHVVLFAISRLLLFSLAQEEEEFYQRCPPFDCGRLGQLRHPFINGTRPPECGPLIVEKCSEDFPTMQLGNGSRFYVLQISPDKTATLADHIPPEVGKPLDNCSSLSFRNLTLPIFPFISFEIPPTAFNCSRKNLTFNLNFKYGCNGTKDSVILPSHFSDPNSSGLPPNCSLVPLQVNKTQKYIEYINLYAGMFVLKVEVTKECLACHKKGRHCQSDNKRNFHCSNTRTGSGKWTSRLHLGVAFGVLALLIVVLSVYIIWHPKKQRYTFPSFNSRYTSSDPSSKSELEVGSAYFGVHIFSYGELSEATNNFSHEKELGNGGFGKVYYAKLRNEREVAVKRLYEHNYKTVEQFMNEVQILTRLHHRNLVTLYGCTSRHNQRGLLLVYEYIPNGTVADHLHGDCVKPGSLTWPTRMKIAIETATALAYLHACEIIHRDVKTNNILLDNNFCVKVADFGLSRLFPPNVTHISTAPQGSPGYVDPEYHQCYQLTDKSDVYSFGVVLIELISSMPAVDIGRHRDEINLANLAVNRIQKCAIDELIDPCLGYQLDEETKRMATSVAELAFLCLQQKKEMRPSMKEVLEELKRIESGEILTWEKEGNDDNEDLKSKRPPPGSPSDCHKSALLKPFRVRSSPISATAKWVSSNTTPHVSS